jgi:bacterial/archaeal transporter family protein
MTIDSRSLWLSVATVVLWGLWGFFGKLALERRMLPATIFIWEVLISAVCAIGVVLFVWVRQVDRSAHAAWNVFGVLSGTGLALGLLCYYLALQGSNASFVVPFTATYPAVAVLLSYAVLGERPSAAQWVGIVLVIVGAALLLSGPASPAKQP